MSPLKDIKVIDLSRFVSGPYCALLLGDMGADVVKVEKPGRGEFTRYIEPGINGESFYSMTMNRSKRGLTLDFSVPEGQALLKKMIAKADVLVENFRPGVMEALGLDWDTLRAINPRLVFARISGFGQEGPYAKRPCFDSVAQAMSGIMHLTGQPGGPPTQAGTFIIDYTSGMYAAMGVLAALNARHDTGKGQVVDVAMLDAATSLLLSAIPETVLAGLELTRTGNRDRFSPPSNTYESADNRWIFLNCASDEQFVRLATAIGRPDLAERYASRNARLAAADMLVEQLAAWAKTLPIDAIVALMEEFSVPAAKVATIDEVASDPQLRQRGQIVDLPHRSGKSVPMQGVTIRLSDTPLSIERMQPEVGEHSDEVLTQWLGLDAGELDRLKHQKII